MHPNLLCVEPLSNTSIACPFRRSTSLGLCDWVVNTFVFRTFSCSPTSAKHVTSSSNKNVVSSNVFAKRRAKRAHTEGAPDREATSRAKALARETEHHQHVKTQKVEMSPATIMALRMMLREEVTAIEENITNKVASGIHELKEELRQEKEARKELEERIAKLENDNKTHRTAAPPNDVDIVEKDRVVIGGFSDMDGEEAEKLVHEVLLGVPGYQGAYATNPAPSVVMAKFDSPAMPLRAIRNQNSIQTCRNTNCGHQKIAPRMNVAAANLWANWRGCWLNMTNTRRKMWLSTTSGFMFASGMAWDTAVLPWWPQMEGWNGWIRMDWSVPLSKKQWPNWKRIWSRMSKHTMEAYNGHVQQCVGHWTRPWMTLSMRNLLNCMLYRKMFRAYERTEDWKICCWKWPYVNLICFVYRNVGAQMGKSVSNLFTETLYI